MPTNIDTILISIHQKNDQSLQLLQQAVNEKDAAKQLDLLNKATRDLDIAKMLQAFIRKVSEFLGRSG